MPAWTGPNLLQNSGASAAASVTLHLCVQHQLGPHINQISPDTVGGDTFIQHRLVGSFFNVSIVRFNSYASEKICIVEWLA